MDFLLATCIFLQHQRRLKGECNNFLKANMAHKHLSGRSERASKFKEWKLHQNTIFSSSWNAESLHWKNVYFFHGKHISLFIELIAREENTSLWKENDFLFIIQASAQAFRTSSTRLPSGYLSIVASIHNQIPFPSKVCWKNGAFCYSFHAT